MLWLLAPPAASAAPQRIISTAPSITEMLYAVGLGNRVVGVTSFCHYPPEVRKKPKIGSYMYPNLETMLALRPDLIVVLKEHAGLAAQLRQLRLNVLELQHNDLAGLFESIRTLGRNTGAEAAAESLVSSIRRDLEQIRARSEGLERRSVLFIVGRAPGMIRDLVIVGRGSFLNELIAIAGGRNLFGDSATFYPKISLEEIYAGRPDVIVDMGDMSDTDRVTEEHRRSVAELWKELPTVPAVQTGRVYAVANDIFVVPGPRVVETARELFKMIHPEAAQ
jgi:iron complex transport system substrate-binding protein